MATSVSIAAVGKPVCNAVQVTTASAKLLEAVTSDRKAIAIQNLGPNAIWVGFTANKTALRTTGFKIAAGDPLLSLDLGNGDSVWAIADTADQVSPADTRVIETR